jgi:hypothetical protein
VAFKADTRYNLVDDKDLMPVSLTPVRREEAFFS